jgi:hypothetical protein
MRKVILFFIVILILDAHSSMAQYKHKNKKLKIYQQEYMPVKGDIYFGKYEVSFYEYFAFLNDLKKSGNSQLYEKCKIDSLSVDSIFMSTHHYQQKENTLNNFPVNNILSMN